MQCFAAGNKPLRHRAAFAARGVGVARIVDDGTIAPTAAISSLPFAPEIVMPATLAMYRRFGSSIYSSYGFLDAVNPSFPVSTIENYRSELTWCVMRGDPYLRQGLERAGFSGGWLESGQRSTSAGRSCSCASRASCVP